MFPTLFGSAVGDATGERARSEAILEASLAVADRGEQVRSQVRGALVEELTAAAARPPGRPADRPSRAADPVRRGPGGDPPVRRDGRARAAPPRRTTASGARAASTPTSCISSTTRGPTPPTRTSDSTSRSSCSMPAGRATSASTRQTAPHEATGLVTLETLDDLGRAAAMSAAAPDTCSAPYRVRFDEAGPDGRLRTSVLLRYAQDLAWYHSAARGFGRAWYAARGITWLVRAAEVAMVAPVPVGADLVGTTQVVGWRRVWARRRTEFRDDDGGLVGLGPHRLGPARRARRADPDPAGVRRGVRRAAGDVRTGPGRRSGTPPADAARTDARRPAAGARPDGPCQQRGLRRLARRGRPGGRRRRRRPGDPAPRPARVRPRRGGRRDRRGDDLARGAPGRGRAGSRTTSGADLLRARDSNRGPPPDDP